VAIFKKDSKTDEYDRDAILAAAAKAEKKGDLEQALAEYRKVLRWEPENAVLQVKAATLLAHTSHLDEAWNAFRAAAAQHVKDGFFEKAISVYTQAAGFFPKKFEIWESLADLYMKRGRKPDALKALLEGRRHLPELEYHRQATQLLRKACEIEPWHYVATYELARLLARAGGREEARHLLLGLATRNHGRELRRARAALFRLTPTPGAAWRWLRAAVRGT
jgi:tetratricopeptide (TPR) repeat protein